MSLSLSALVASAIEEGEGQQKKRKVAAVEEQQPQPPQLQQPQQQQVLVGTRGSEFVKTRLARDGPQAIPYIQQHHGLSTKYDKWRPLSVSPCCLTPLFSHRPT